MPHNRLPRRDVTALFMASPAQAPEVSGKAQQGLVLEGEIEIRPLPLPDPLGLLEWLSQGRVKDPLSPRVLLERVRSYLAFLGNQP